MGLKTHIFRGLGDTIRDLAIMQHRYNQLLRERIAHALGDVLEANKEINKGDVMDDNEIERKIITHLIDTMVKHGWVLGKVYDGELHYPPSADVMGIISPVAESTLTFLKDGKRHTVCIALPNGADCISHYEFGLNDDFEQIMANEIAPFAETFQ